MAVLLVVLVPVIVLVVWAVIFDLRRRRRHGLTSHDIGSAARRAEANADARTAGWTDSGGGSSY